MKRIKFTGLVIAIVMIFATLCSGCGVLRKPIDIDKEMQAMIEKINFDADENYEGSLKIFAQSKDTEKAAIEALIESFNEKYPKIKVTLQTYVAGSYIGTVRNLHSSAMSPTGSFEDMADVFWMTNETIPALVTQQMIAPINYLVDADSKFSTSGLVESMVEDSKFGGNLYMMPRDYNQFVMYYNRWFFEQFDLSKHDIDINELLESGEAMTEADLQNLMYTMHNLMTNTSTSTPMGGKLDAGQVIDVLWNWGSMSYGVYRMFGADVADKDGNIVFDSDATFKAIDWVKQACFNGYTPMAGGDQGSGDFFKTYSAPFCIETRAVFTDIIESHKDKLNWAEHIGVCPMPMLDTEENYRVGAGCSGYAMYQNAVHPTEAWLFLKHVVSREGQEAYGATGNSVPVLKELIDDPNAAWRNIENVPSDFNHDAFVYKYDTNACIMAEFKSRIPAEAVSRVAGCMNDALVTGVKNTPNDPDKAKYEKQVKKIISDQATYMAKEVANKKNKK